MPLFPTRGLRPGQREAVSGIRPRREDELRAALQAQIPAMRARRERRKRLGLYQAEQEQLAEQHESEMELGRERLAAEKEAAGETAKLGRARLGLESAAQKESEQQAKYFMWLQGAGLALQAYESIWDRDDDWTTEYGGGGDGIEITYDYAW